MSAQDAVQLYHKRGCGRLDIGDIDGALGDFDRVIALDPAYAEAYQQRGLVHRCRGDLDLALADFSRTLELTASEELTCRAYFHRALTRVSQGDVDGALDDLTALLEHRPSTVEAYLNRGTLRLRSGDRGTEVGQGPGAKAATAWARWPTTTRPSGCTRPTSACFIIAACCAPSRAIWPGPSATWTITCAGAGAVTSATRPRSSSA